MQLQNKLQEKIMEGTLIDVSAAMLQIPPNM